MARKVKFGAVKVPLPWLPISLEFLRSIACANLSPHATKLLLFVLSRMGVNGYGNGDIHLGAKQMEIYGWTSRSTLAAATIELVEAGILSKTRQGNRRVCCLYACTLYELNCKLEKLDVKPGSYGQLDYTKGGLLKAPPCNVNKACWNRVRKEKELALPAPRLKRPSVVPMAKEECSQPATPHAVAGEHASNDQKKKRPNFRLVA